MYRSGAPSVSSDLDVSRVRIFHGERVVLPLPEDHRIPMETCRRLRERVTDQGEGTRPAPDAATHQVLRIHDADDLCRVAAGMAGAPA